MKKETTFFESVLKSAMMTGLAVIAITLIGYMLDLTTNKLFGILGFVVLLVGIVLGTKQVRENVLKGSITYGKAFVSGLLISVFAGVIVGIFSFILYKFIDPTLFDKILAIQEEAYLNAGMSEDQVEMTIEMARKMMSPVMTMISSIFGYALIGGIISLITSAILKRENAIANPFAEVEE